MGYYTNYSLEVKNLDVDSDDDVTEESVISALRSEIDEAATAFDIYGTTENNCKWYNAKEDVAKFSKMYPTWLFTLSGEGEEAGDLWKCYILNGKTQDAPAQISYDEFDESKLS